MGGDRFHIIWTAAALRLRVTGDVKWVPLDQLIAELAALPNWAWPEGRVVQLERPGLYRRGQRAIIEASYRAAKELLEKHGYIVRPSLVCG